LVYYHVERPKAKRHGFGASGFSCSAFAIQFGSEFLVLLCWLQINEIWDVCKMSKKSIQAFAKAEEDSHLHTAIFAMDFMKKVLEKSRSQSKLDEEEKEKLYNKIQYKWQEKLRLEGHLPIPRPDPIEGVNDEETPSSSSSRDQRVQSSGDVRLTTPLKPLQRPLGRLCGKPAPYMAPIPYYDGGTASTSAGDLSLWVKSRLQGKDTVGVVHARPAQHHHYYQVNKAATMASMGSNEVSALKGHGKRIISQSQQDLDHLSIDMTMPLTYQRKRRRTMNRVNNKTQLLQQQQQQQEEGLLTATNTNYQEEDLILGMQIAVDPQYFENQLDAATEIDSASHPVLITDTDNSSSSFRLGRIVQIHHLGKSIGFSSFSSSQSNKCHLTLREPQTGRELGVIWPNRFLSIYHPVGKKNQGKSAVSSQQQDEVDLTLSIPAKDNAPLELSGQAVGEVYMTSSSVEQIQNALADILGDFDMDAMDPMITGHDSSVLSQQNALEFLQNPGASTTSSFLPHSHSAGTTQGMQETDYESALQPSFFFHDSNDEDDDEEFLRMLDAHAPAIVPSVEDVSNTMQAITSSLSTGRNPDEHIEFVRLVNGETVSEVVVNDVEAYFNRLEKSKRLNLVYNQKFASGMDPNVDIGDIQILPDEDPQTPLVEPDVVVVGKLRKVNVLKLLFLVK
jgi:hypothetical protein